MMTDHHVKEAGQNKLNVGTSGSEWCKGCIITDSVLHSYPVGKECLFEYYAPYQRYEKHYSMVKHTNDNQSAWWYNRYSVNVCRVNKWIHGCICM